MSPETAAYETAVTEAVPFAATAVPAAAVDARQPVGPATKLAYGIGALSDSVKTFGFTTFLLFYYTTVLGLPGALLGLTMAVGLVWDAVIDPFIGHLSDRARVRFGRRHVPMLIGALCAGASFIAVFNPPVGLSNGLLFVWLMTTSLIMRSSNSLFMVPYAALGAELAADYHERTSVTAYRAAATYAGTLLTTAAAFLVYLPPTTASSEDAKFLRGSYASLGVTLGLVMIGTALVAAIGTLHTRSRLAGPPPAQADATLRRTVAAAFRSSSFRVLFASTCLSFMATAINAALAFHYLTYFARVDTRGVTMYMAALYSGGLAGVVVWHRVSKVIEKHWIYALATITMALVTSSGYWLVGEGRFFGTGAVWVLTIGNALGGFFGAAGVVLAPSMMADITSQDEQHTGRRRDGSFFGIFSLGQQLSGGIAVLLAGVLVDRFAGLVPAQSEQSAATVERIALISNILPAVLLLGAGALALRYRLRRRDVDLPSAGRVL
jgi:glycoside/pentoside/hexuronide:cation symporter, GPH family